MFHLLVKLGSVFLPMYMESDDLKEWVSNSGTCKILMSIDEIRSLKHQRGKKNALNKIIEVSNSIGIDVIDFRKDLELDIETEDGKTKTLKFKFRR